MGKNSIKKPDFKVPVPFVIEPDKESDESDLKGVSVKLLLDAQGKKISNPTTQVQPVYHQGTVEQFFKWVKSLNSILLGQTITEHFRLALQSLRGTDKALWQREWDAASPALADAAGISPDAAMALLRKAIMSLTQHVLKDDHAGYKQK